MPFVIVALICWRNRNVSGKMSSQSQNLDKVREYVFVKFQDFQKKKNIYIYTIYSLIK